MIYENILEAMGNTPLVQLNKLADSTMARVLVKCEFLNVGGAIKTRTAFGMLNAAEKEGVIGPDTIIVEPTSGNQGVGLALVAAVRGYKARIIMPDSVSEERRKLVQLYGAEVVTVHDEGDIGKCIDDCIQLAKKMATENPRVYVPQQFENINNVIAQRETAREILAQCDGTIDGFCSGIGTGGSISGIGQVLKEANPDTRIVAVEPEHAAILSGGGIGTHLQMGIGDGLIPDILDMDIYDDVCIVTDDEALGMARQLAAKEGLACGISSGTNVTAALILAKKLGPGKTVVTLLPDTAERYYSTELFE